MKMKASQAQGICAYCQEHGWICLLCGFCPNHCCTCGQCSACGELVIAEQFVFGEAECLPCHLAAAS